MSGLHRKPVALTIAGSDSSGGAGISADLKGFAVAGVHGANVITCITAQNTIGVQEVEPVSLDLIEAQLDSVLSDLKPMSIKTGMLYSSDIIELVVKKIASYKKSIDTANRFNLVVDPVLIATTGASLTQSGKPGQTFSEVLKNSLIPIANLVTPNIHEANQLLGWDISSLDEMKRGCLELHKLGVPNVLIKGGHLGDSTSDKNSTLKVYDVFFNGELHIYDSPRFDKDVHGSGCTLASLITGYLAIGIQMEEAIRLAKQVISLGIEKSLRIGSGVEAVNTTSTIRESKENLQIKSEITYAADRLLTILNINYMPEVGINIGYAKPGANSLDDICALSGRIVRVGFGLGYLGKPEFGASKHIARIIFAAMSVDKTYRCSMNIKYRSEIVEVCNQLKFKIGTFDRKNEPKEGSSMEWGTKQAISDLGIVPDIVFDIGGIGKEPMIRVLGTDPENVIEKVEKIIEFEDGQ